MDYIEASRALNRSILRVAESINSLAPVVEEKKAPYIRLEENPFVLTEEMKDTREVVTAHDLVQYKRHFHSIKLEDDMRSVLQLLLEIDREDDM